MSTKISKKEYKLSNSAGLITSKWSQPIEGFTPHPKYATPIRCGLTQNIDNLIENINISQHDVLLAHETTKESAQKIMNSGFKEEEKGFCSLRDKAIFGWVHKTDIGYFSNKEYKSATHTVLFTVPRNKVFVSSYETSARQLLLGEITSEEYKAKHVLKYNDYESLHWNQPDIVKHLNYNPESLLSANYL